MKSLIITILMSCIVAFSSFAQKAALTGIVTNSNKETIVGANVTLRGTVRGVQTNAKGEYAIKGLQAGKYTLVVSFVGYVIVEKHITLDENQTLHTNIVMLEANNTLQDIKVVASRGVRGNEHLAEVDGYTINATKKNELVRLDNIDADLAMNNSRQIFGRVPGISVWESDGSGIQTSIASRGLSPNRSWEFNTGSARAGPSPARGGS